MDPSGVLPYTFCRRLMRCPLARLPLGEPDDDGAPASPTTSSGHGDAPPALAGAKKSLGGDLPLSFLRPR
jgi:hypothetical protein